MGEVFLARRRDGDPPEVVIKRLLPEHAAEPGLISMLRGEARLTSRLTHENIVQLIEFGESDGIYYLVLEYVRGSSLRALLSALKARNEMLSIPECALVAIEVARALEYAHSKRAEDGAPLDIVHRDVTPSNILVSTDGKVKLTDFGIARARARAWQMAGEQQPAGTGNLFPEGGTTGELDLRADLASFGAMLYEVLTGLSPFARPEDAAALRISPDSLRPPTAFNPAIPDEVEALVMRLLHPEPQRRPARSQEVVDALRPFAESVPPASELLRRTVQRVLDPGAAAARAEAPTPDITSRVRGSRILLVDESRALRSQIRSVLGTRYFVSEASSATEARAAIERGAPSAVLCPDELSGASGLDLCRFMRADPQFAAIPFVLLTEDLSPELSSAAEAAGAQAVLEKPSDPTRLFETLQVVLDGSRAAAATVL